MIQELCIERRNGRELGMAGARGMWEHGGMSFRGGGDDG